MGLKKLLAYLRPTTFEHERMNFFISPLNGAYKPLKLY
jgi:hypothetical protein